MILNEISYFRIRPTLAYLHVRTQGIKMTEKFNVKNLFHVQSISPNISYKIERTDDCRQNFFYNSYDANNNKSIQNFFSYQTYFPSHNCLCQFHLYKNVVTNSLKAKRFRYFLQFLEIISTRSNEVFYEMTLNFRFNYILVELTD